MTKAKNWDVPYYIEPLVRHSDERGALFEAMRFTSQNIPTGGQVYVYTVEPGVRRGDHYHAKKMEWFSCVSGTVRLLMKTPQRDLVDEVLDSDAPKMVYAGPGTSHAVVNETGITAVVVAYASKEFDPSNPDTILEPAD
ncbi:polysaccharide biosynthesis C-terminal domain-containing protein [Kiloniella spongiae]|nr:WxcM-like domain-containing protein [Kiloniella spongiae]